MSGLAVYLSTVGRKVVGGVSVEIVDAMEGTDSGRQRGVVKNAGRNEGKRAERDAHVIYLHMTFSLPNAFFSTLRMRRKLCRCKVRAGWGRIEMIAAW